MYGLAGGMLYNLKWSRSKSQQFSQSIIMSGLQEKNVLLQGRSVMAQKHTPVGLYPFFLCSLWLRIFRHVVYLVVVKSKIALLK